MAAVDYDACEAHVLASEGGYTNNAADPGGPTNWGITIYDARLYWKTNATAADVKAMPKSVAQDIYRKKYWNALECDDLPAGLDYTVFDYGVNSGIARAGKILRQCIGLSAADWHVTGDVIAALAKRDIKTLIAEIDDERLNFLEHLSTWPVFRGGWAPRVASVRAVSLQMAASPASVTIAPVVNPEVQAAGKAVAAPKDILAHLAPSSWTAVKSAPEAAPVPPAKQDRKVIAVGVLAPLVGAVLGFFAHHPLPPLAAPVPALDHNEPAVPASAGNGSEPPSAEVAPAAPPAALEPALPPEPDVPLPLPRPEPAAVPPHPVPHVAPRPRAQVPVDTSTVIALCKGDAMRLCNPTIADAFDHSRIENCMAKNRAQLSRGCAAVFSAH